MPLPCLYVGRVGEGIRGPHEGDDRAADGRICSGAVAAVRHEVTAYDGQEHSAQHRVVQKVGVGATQRSDQFDERLIGVLRAEVIRINSQSGKGGIAHLLHTHHGLDLPRAMRPDFSQAVQHLTDATGSELSHKELWELFRTTYITPALDGPVTLAAWNTTEPVPGEHQFSCTLHADGQEHSCRGTGNGPLSALADALRTVGITVDIVSYTEHSTATGPGSPAVAYAECRVNDVTCWGAGWDTSVLTASVHSVMAAVNRSGRASS
jgi:2-isopropylmalate synthase